MNHFFSKKGGQKFFPIVWLLSFVGRNKTKKKTHDFKWKLYRKISNKNCIENCTIVFMVLNKLVLNKQHRHAWTGTGNVFFSYIYFTIKKEPTSIFYDWSVFGKRKKHWILLFFCLYFFSFVEKISKHQTNMKTFGELKKRRERDSNPRYEWISYNGLAISRFRPLSHLSFSFFVHIFLLFVFWDFISLFCFWYPCLCKKNKKGLLVSGLTETRDRRPTKRWRQETKKERNKTKSTKMWPKKWTQRPRFCLLVLFFFFLE